MFFLRKPLTTYTMSTNSKMVAIQGESGSHSDVAAQELLGFDVSLDHCDSIAATFESVLEKTATCALLPLENTTAGIIQPVWDHFLGMPLGRQTMVATKEIRHRVGFVAARRKGADLKNQTHSFPPCRSGAVWRLPVSREMGSSCLSRYGGRSASGLEKAPNTPPTLPCVRKPRPITTALKSSIVTAETRKTRGLVSSSSNRGRWNRFPTIIMQSFW